MGCVESRVLLPETCFDVKRWGCLGQKSRVSAARRPAVQYSIGWYTWRPGESRNAINKGACLEHREVLLSEVAQPSDHSLMKLTFRTQDGGRQLDRTPFKTGWVRHAAGSTVSRRLKSRFSPCQMARDVRTRFVPVYGCSSLRRCGARARALRTKLWRITFVRGEAWF